MILFSFRQKSLKWQNIITILYSPNLIIWIKNIFKIELDYMYEIPQLSGIFFTQILNLLFMLLHDIQTESLKQELKQSQSTIFHKYLGRSVKPMLGNRITKDFYDLDYDITNNTSFKKSQKLPIQYSKKGIGMTRQMEKKKETIKSKSPRLSQDKNESPNNKIPKYTPERIIIPCLQPTQQILGLCPYEYSKTIQGRMQKRSNHHLSYQKNKISRIINENPVYYNINQSIDLTTSRLAQEKNVLKMFHPFNSYTKRRTFQPRQQLDKIFDTASGYKVASVRRIPQRNIKFESFIQRRPPRLSQSVDLSYQFLPAIDSLKSKSLSYSMANRQREIQFYPQVISPKRGCFR